jgi:vacuolar-type H+-ATPase subunit I/STV1
MEPSKLNELPFWFQIVAGLGLFFGTASIAVLGWIKKNVSGGLFGEKEDSKSAVVLSASIADSASIKRLAEAVEGLCRHLERRDEDNADGLERIHRSIKDLIEEAERNTKAIRERTLM